MKTLIKISAIIILLSISNYSNAFEIIDSVEIKKANVVESIESQLQNYGVSAEQIEKYVTEDRRIENYLNDIQEKMKEEIEIEKNKTFIIIDAPSKPNVNNIFNYQIG